MESIKTFFTYTLFVVAIAGLTYSLVDSRDSKPKPTHSKFTYPASIYSDGMTNQQRSAEEDYYDHLHE